MKLTRHQSGIIAICSDFSLLLRIFTRLIRCFSKDLMVLFLPKMGVGELCLILLLEALITV